MIRPTYNRIPARYGNCAALGASLKARRLGCVGSRASAACSCHSPSLLPVESLPRWLNPKPDPAIRSSTVLDTSTSPGSERSATRPAISTAAPASAASPTSDSPVWMPARNAMPAADVRRTWPVRVLERHRQVGRVPYQMGRRWPHTQGCFDHRSLLVRSRPRRWRQVTRERTKSGNSACQETRTGRIQIEH